MNGSYQIHQWNHYKTMVHAPTTMWRAGTRLTVEKVVGKAHPNIYELVEVIKKEEALTIMQVQQLVAGALQPPRRGKSD